MWIELRKFKISTIIGVHDYERKAPQELLLNLQIRVDATNAVQSDSIHDALDYEKLHQKIINLAQNSSYQLLESLVDRIEKLVLEDGKALEVFVEIEKPRILKDCEAVIVRNFK